jgi:peptide deformylase
MAIKVDKLKIVVYPAPVLRKKAQPIKEINEEVRAVAAKMIQLMHEAPGVGLAAPQVGVSWRMFVTSHSGKPEDDMVFINPVILDPSRETDDYDEGCLSLPEIRGMIRRPTGVTIQATGLDGRPFALASSDFPARVWQHEYDHLDGVLILDKMTPMDRKATQRKVRELDNDAAPKKKKLFGK